jgi:rhodanese-related sulfurtransferase
MRDRNLAGAGEVRPWKATPVSSEAVSSVIGDGGYVVDLRERRSFAGRHLVGTVNLELGANLATYLGWLFPFEAPITLVARDDTELESARELLARIGREELAAWATTREIVDQNEGATGRYRVATFVDLARDGAAGMPTVLDVRHRSEWRAGHLRGARHIPLPELAGADLDLAPDVGAGPIWVHCAAGFRAAVAASILSAGGRTPVLIDDLFLHAKAAGLEVVDETSAIAQSV